MGNDGIWCVCDVCVLCDVCDSVVCVTCVYYVMCVTLYSKQKEQMMEEERVQGIAAERRQKHAVDIRNQVREGEGRRGEGREGEGRGGRVGERGEGR